MSEPAIFEGGPGYKSRRLRMAGGLATVASVASIAYLLFIDGVSDDATVWVLAGSALVFWVQFFWLLRRLRSRLWVELKPEGFAEHGYFRDRFVGWDTCSAFEVVNGCVAFDRIGKHEGFASRLARILSGSGDSVRVPFESPDIVCETMNSLRDQVIRNID